MTEKAYAYVDFSKRAVEQLDPLVLGGIHLRPDFTPPDARQLKAVGTLLYQCHTNNDSRKLRLLKDVQRILAQCIVSPPDGRECDWLIVHSSDIGKTILRIAMDHDVYAVEEGGSVKAYAHGVVRTLALCLHGYAKAIHITRDKHIHAEASSLLQKSSEIFSFFWDRREKLLDIRPIHFAMPFFRQVLRLACVAISLHITCNQKTPKIRQGHAQHVLMYCWTYSRHSYESFVAFELFREVLETEVQQKPPNPRPSAKFFDEAVFATGSADEFISKVAYIFLDPAIRDSSLTSLVECLGMVAEVSPELMRPLKPTLLREYLLNWSIACHRQICGGGRPAYESLIDLSGVKEREVYVFQMAFNILVHIIREPLYGSSELKQTVWSAVYEQIRPMKLIQLMGHCLSLPSANYVEHSLLYFCRYPLGQCWNFMQWEDIRAKYSPDVAEAIKEGTRLVWFPTLQAMRAIPQMQSNNVPSLLEEAASMWLQLGEMCGLKASDPVVQDPKPTRESGGCNWYKCLCTVSPRHRMKACTGCESVMYCSARCQTLDWKKGKHRNVCRGRVNTSKT